MSWFKRITSGILTPTKNKKETPDGIWHKCKECSHKIMTKEHLENLSVCTKCSHHNRIPSADYFNIIFDNAKYERLFSDIQSYDHLEFTDLKPYSERLVATRKKSGLDDSIQVATGKSGKNKITIAAMDFSFIGGSMGSVMGERIARGIDYAIENRTAFMIISKSGGARMMEGAFSLMQMAKTSAKLTQLADAQLPYLSFLSDPTTGGVTASFAMLGDVNFSEPNALIGFAGPRVIEETIKQKLPKGFQRSEFLLDKGFLDFIVERKDLKQKIVNILNLFSN